MVRWATFSSRTLLRAVGALMLVFVLLRLTATPPPPTIMVDGSGGHGTTSPPTPPPESATALRSDEASPLVRPPHKFVRVGLPADAFAPRLSKRAAEALTLALDPHRLADLKAVADGAETAVTAPSVLRPAGGKDRRPSLPFITGDGFRAACTLIFDETTIAAVKAGQPGDEAYGTHFGSAKLRPNTTVFVQTHLLNDFLTLVVDAGRLSSSAKPIVLVTHNSDYSAPWEAGNTRAKNGVVGRYEHHRKRLLDDASLVSVWYAQNPVLEHPRLVPIPIGIENRYNKFGEHVDAYEAAARAKESALAVDALVGGGAEQALLRPLVAFSVKTNPLERQAAAGAARHPSFGVQSAAEAQTSLGKTARGADSKATLTRFLRRVQEVLVVLAPKGHGVDTHRLWETLYAGRLPITSPSPLFTAGPLAAHLVPRGRVLVLRSSAADAETGGQGAAASAWQQLTAEWVRKALREASTRLPSLNSDENTGDDDVLSMSFWIVEIHRHQNHGPSL